MAARGSDPPDVLVDTSVAIALVVGDHEHHRATFEALDGRRLGLAGHAAFESFSVLTRLPPPARRTLATVGSAPGRDLPAQRIPQRAGRRRTLVRLEPLRIAGGSIYDALVGATAAEHGITLATRDHRALATYRALDVEVELLS